MQLVQAPPHLLEHVRGYLVQWRAWSAGMCYFFALADVVLVEPASSPARAHVASPLAEMTQLMKFRSHILKQVAPLSREVTQLRIDQEKLLDTS